MAYKQQATILSVIIGALALVYVLSVFFEPDRAGSRSAAFTWLDPKLTNGIDRISIKSSGGETILVRKNNEWFVSYSGKDFPAKQLRIEDFIGILTRRAPYPVRSSNPGSHERLGLGEETASRITISAGAGLPLLDLLVGQGDNTGREVYLRKAGQNEVRSGEDQFGAYLSSARNSWYNLRLFPETSNGGLDAGAVQRLSVYPPPVDAPAEDGGKAAAPQVFTRSGQGWTLNGVEDGALDSSEVDGYIRDILNTEGDDFSEGIAISDPVFENSRLALEFSDGSVKTVYLTAPGENNRRNATVSGSDYVYSLAGWSATRLFRDSASFVKKAE